ncbi:hypothetical protein ACFWPK_19440 [Nocardia sp. NPDC058519]|uniref:hypothetical protein n=1 Tax=Nocardia sp. NPDC058519 TaxID=3346535 RepID=UPI00365D0066
MLVDEPGGQATRELAGQQGFESAVTVAELVADAADDQAVVELGLARDLDGVVGIGGDGQCFGSAVVDEEPRRRG